MKRDETNEIIISSIRSIFGAVPYAGQFLNEITFEYRSRIKQERLNKFTILLSEFFTINQDIDLENIKKEDFSDLFESVLKRVVQTKSEEKHRRFKNILINQMKNPSLSYDNTEIYLDLISSLSENEISILKHHQIFDETFNKDKETLEILENSFIKKQGLLTISGRMPPKEREQVMNDHVKLKEDIEIKKKKMEDAQKVRNHDFYKINQEDFLYYKQVLYSKGLLEDVGIGAISSPPFLNMRITEFGRKFIQFIIEKSDIS